MKHAMLLPLLHIDSSNRRVAGDRLCTVLSDTGPAFEPVRCRLEGVPVQKGRCRCVGDIGESPVHHHDGLRRFRRKTDIRDRNGGCGCCVFLIFSQRWPQPWAFWMDCRQRLAVSAA